MLAAAAVSVGVGVVRRVDALAVAQLAFAAARLLTLESLVLSGRLDLRDDRTRVDAAAIECALELRLLMHLTNCTGATNSWNYTRTDMCNTHGYV